MINIEAQIEDIDADIKDTKETIEEMTVDLVQFKRYLMSLEADRYDLIAQMPTPDDDRDRKEDR